MRHMPDGMRIVERVATGAEFRELRTDAGWRLPPDGDIDVALANTLFGVCVETVEGRTVGMGRIVGDGGAQFFITDVIVHREWQNQGLGTGIMAALMRYIDAHASPAAFVGLFSALGRHKFYERFGFVVRPNEKLGPGMVFFPTKSAGHGS